MQLRSGKFVLSPVSNKDIFQFRSGRVVVRVKYTPRSYIKRKNNIELRSGRLVSHKKYTKRPYVKRNHLDVHVSSMIEHYKSNYSGMYETLQYVTNFDSRKTIDMIREWQENEKSYKEYYMS